MAYSRVYERKGSPGDPDTPRSYPGGPSGKVGRDAQQCCPLGTERNGDSEDSRPSCEAPRGYKRGDARSEG